MIGALLQRLDPEYERELVLRWRSWKCRWFPYRTAEYLGYDPETLELRLGNWRWHRPDRFTKSDRTPGEEKA